MIRCLRPGGTACRGVVQGSARSHLKAQSRGSATSPSFSPAHTDRGTAPYLCSSSDHVPSGADTQPLALPAGCSNAVPRKGLLKRWIRLPFESCVFSFHDSTSLSNNGGPLRFKNLNCGQSPPPTEHRTRERAPAGPPCTPDGLPDSGHKQRPSGKDRTDWFSGPQP